jgi:hypothetical protein
MRETKIDRRPAKTKPAAVAPAAVGRPFQFTPNNAVRVVGYAKGAENEEERQALMATANARHLTRPGVTSAQVIDVYQPGAHDVNALADELARQIAVVNSGDLSRAEGLLVAQAHALDRVFATLMARAAQQQHLPGFEAHMRMALRAQNQCRSTLETLAALKYPSAVFAHQANFNHGGQQQVNNGVAPLSAAPLATRVPETESQPSRLLEANDGQRLDTGAKGAGSAADPVMAPVGAVDRADNRRRQGEGRAQRIQGRPAAGAAPALKAAARAAPGARRVRP